MLSRRFSILVRLVQASRHLAIGRLTSDRGLHQLGIPNAVTDKVAGKTRKIQQEERSLPQKFRSLER
jgi:hypothetical protein